MSCSKGKPKGVHIREGRTLIPPSVYRICCNLQACPPSLAQRSNALAVSPRADIQSPAYKSPCSTDSLRGVTAKRQQMLYLCLWGTETQLWSKQQWDVFTYPSARSVFTNLTKRQGKDCFATLGLYFGFQLIKQPSKSATHSRVALDH